MAEITDLLIKSKSGEYDLEMVRRLTISSMKLSRISGQGMDVAEAKPRRIGGHSLQAAW